jgi:hypothetical protein
MRTIRLEARDVTGAELEGKILVHDLGPELRKGHVLRAADATRLRGAGELHLVELEPGDVHEDEAATRLADAIAGTGIETGAPLQSQIRLTASHRGLVRVDASVVLAVNRLPGVSVFTLIDGQAVNAGEEVAGCKVTPVAVPGAVLEEAEELARAAAPAVRVLPFRALRTFVVVTERLKPRARELFSEAVSRKLGWYGADLVATRQVARTAAGVAGAYMEAGAAGAQLVLFAGASAIDPLDAAYAELSRAGGELLRLGAPAHPGSMLWLGRLGEATVLGIASCAGFGRNTSLDLILPHVFANGEIDGEALDDLGHGGLIEKGAGRRFPPYER